MKKLNMLCFVTMIVTIGCLGLNNYKLGKRVSQLEGEAYYVNMHLNDTSMKLEMFLSMIEEEMHSSIRRISRPIAREEVIKGFKQFAENFNKAGVQKGLSDEESNRETKED